MSIIESKYKPPFLFKNNHLQTIYALMRKKAKIHYQRERIDTPDGDFIDLDWSIANSNRLAVLLPGLEGNSEKVYMLNLAEKLNNNRWDVVVFNYRGTNGESNRLPRFYHYGETGDLSFVLSLNKIKKYEQITLIGCSLGGNIVLKYAGEKSGNIADNIKCVAAFSAPIDFKTCSVKISEQKLYCNHFLDSYKKKLKMKKQIMPESLDISGIQQMKTIMDYDKKFILPFFPEFKGLDDFYNRCGFVNHMADIKIPAYLILSRDDPFFYESSIAAVYDFARNSDNFYFELTDHGGHAGFILNSKDSYYEFQIMKFIEEYEI